MKKICSFILIGLFTGGLIAQNLYKDIGSAEIYTGPKGKPVVTKASPVLFIPASYLGDTLFFNGTSVNGPASGPGIPDSSILENVTLGMTTLGAGHALSSGYRMADDFTVSGDNVASWHIDSIAFFAYQTGSGTTSTINHVNLRIWNGTPGVGSVVFGDNTTNRMIRTHWSNMYRFSENAFGTTRPVMRNVVAVDFELPAGTYWLDWQSGGTLSSGPWAPPIAIKGVSTTGNGLQYDPAATTWNVFNDGGTLTQQGLPFVIYGHAITNVPGTPKPVTNPALYSDYFSPNSMTVTWTDPTEFTTGDPIDTFVVDIYRDGTLRGTVAKGIEEFIETGGLTYHQLVSYELYVRQIPTDSLSTVTTTGTWYVGGHPTPSAPTNFAATGYSNRAELSWTDPTTNVDGTPIGDLDSIRIYRNGVHIANVADGVLAYTDNTVTGDYYTYKIQAIDDESPANASLFTGEIQVYAGPQPGIAVNPDPVNIYLLSGEMGLDSFYIYNTGNVDLVINGIEAEELTTAKFVPTWTQPQKYTPDYPKGAIEPTHGPVTEGSGGPDPYGYKWKDSDEPGGPAVDFIDISTTGTQITFSSNDDGYTPIPLPFPVKFYGNSYSGNLTVSTNGWIGFNTYTSSYLTNVAIPAVGDPNNIIAPFWDDLNGNNPGSKVVYQTMGNKFIIQWVNFNRYGNTGGDLNFQVILTQNSDKIEIQYATMNQGSGTTNSHTIGIENSDGTMGLQVAYNASYITNNRAIVFQKGVEWLVMTPTTGTVAAGDSMKVYTQINSTGLLGGLHKAKAIIDHNIPLVPAYQHPEIRLHVTGIPDIAVSPGLLDFGTIFIGASDTMTFNVTNTGTDILTVSGLSLNQSLPAYSIVTTTPFDVAIGQNYPVRVAFSSATPGTFLDTVLVVSDGASGDKMVALTGTAIELPVIQVSETNINNSVALGDTDITELVIRNIGNSNLLFNIRESENVFTYLAKGVKTPTPRAEDINYGGPHSIGRAPMVNAVQTDNPVILLAADAQNAFAAQIYPALSFGRFCLNTPGTFVTKGTPPTLFAGDYSTDGSVFYAVNYDNGHFGTIDTANGSFTSVGVLTGVTSGQSVTGISVDPADETIYLSTTNVATSELYTINPTTAVATLVGPMTGMAGTIDIAVNPDGEMYGYCIVSDHFYSIDKTTGAATDIGPLGFDASYAQGMDFDPNDGTCYLAAYNVSSNQGELRTVDLISGASTLIGAFPGGSEVDALGILPLGLNWIDASPTSGTVAAGDSAVINLNWYGVEAGFHQGYLGVSSNDPANPMVNVHVQLNVLVGIDEQSSRPASYALHQNYPNPFNPTTTIKYDLKDAGKVTLKIYNILGQEVRTLVNKNESAGFKSVVWDGKDNAGRMVSSGLYIYRIEAGKFVKSQKMMFLK